MYSVSLSKTYRLCCVLIGLLCGLAVKAQVIDSASGTLPGVDTDHNKRLRVQLDRTTIRAYEPVYLSITAERFVALDTRPEVSVWQGEQTPQTIVLENKSWMITDTQSGPDIRLQRQGVVLHRRGPTAGGGANAYLFPKAGDYFLRIKVGPDAPTLKIKVVAGEDREREAWDRLGDELDAIVYNGIEDPPRQKTVDTCSRIIRAFPGTVCAGYCQVYISVSRFKQLFDRSGKSGGKAAYADITKELKKINDSFGETFLGEQTAFYTAYALGLTRDFQTLLAVADGVKTHVTPFSDALQAMKAEVLQHMSPQVIPVDPTTMPAATTRPTTTPAK